MKISVLDPVKLNDKSSSPEWEEIAKGLPGYTIYHSVEWTKFIERTQRVKRQIYEISDRGRIVGYLPGFIFRKGPIRIFASPFEGWYTPYMGVLLSEGTDCDKVLQLIYRQLKKDRFHFAQFTPPSVCDIETIQKNGFTVQRGKTYIAEVGQSPEIILENFRKSTRYNVRRAIRDGLKVRFTTDKAFVDTFYDQLCQVFLKNNMRPTYSKEKVHAFWDTLMPTGKLFATEVVYGQKVIATRLEIFHDNWIYAHGSASDQDHLKLKPNELARYHVMSHGAENGFKYYDMMGGGKYKAQFGGKQVTIITAIYDPYGLLGLKNLAKRLLKAQFRFGKRK